MRIICKTHGEFWQTPKLLLKGCKCPKCVGGVPITQEEWLLKAVFKHGLTYDYCVTLYKGAEKHIEIICKKHGAFWQKATLHLLGSGCPKCKMSHMERDIILYLEKHNINFIYQFKAEWLGLLSLDVFLPDYNIGIECLGRLHFEPVTAFGGIDAYNEQVLLDLRKYKLCKLENILLVYYSNISYDTFLNEKVYHTLDELFATILPHIIHDSSVSDVEFEEVK